MTIAEIKEFLAANAEDTEVKAFLAELSPEKNITTDEVVEFLKGDDGKAIVQPMIDQAVTKAVKTRDKAHAEILETEVKKRVAAKVLEMNPQEEPWQKEIRELNERLENEKAERARDQLKRQLVEEASKSGVDPALLEDYLPESFEVGKVFIQKIKNLSKTVADQATNALLANGYKPAAGQSKDNGQKVDLSKLSQAEMIELEMKGELDKSLSA